MTTYRGRHRTVSLPHPEFQATTHTPYITIHLQIKALKVGLPWEKGVAITPLPEPSKPAYLEQLIGDAVLAGWPPWDVNLRLATASAESTTLDRSINHSSESAHLQNPASLRDLTLCFDCVT